MQVVAALLLLREISRIFESGSMGFEGSQRPLGPFLEAIWPPVLAVALAAVEAPAEHALSALVLKVRFFP